MLAGHDVGQVSNDDVESADIFAGVVARLVSTGYRRNGDDHGRNDDNSCVSAVFENSTIASFVIGRVAVEYGNIELSISSSIAYSLSGNLLLVLFSLARTATAAL